MMNPETSMTTTTTESLVTPDDIGAVGLANEVSEDVLAFKRQKEAEAAIKPNRKQRRATEANMRRAVRKMRKEISG